MFAEWLQPGQMAHNFARPPEQVIFQFILFIEAEANTRLGFRVKVSYKECEDSGKLAFSPGINERGVVDQNIIRWRTISEIVYVPRQLNEVRRDNRGVEFQGFDAVVLRPVDALPLDSVGKVMACFRSLFPGNFNVAEVDLALYFSRIQAASPDGESLSAYPSVCGFVDWIAE